jgi:hypothetical protein
MHAYEWRTNLPGGKMQRESTAGERRNSGELVLLLRPHDAEARSEFCADRKAWDPPTSGGELLASALSLLRSSAMKWGKCRWL